MSIRWSPVYYSKREIREMNNQDLLTAFEGSVADQLTAQINRGRIPSKLNEQTEFIRDVLVSRFK